MWYGGTWEEFIVGICWFRSLFAFSSRFWVQKALLEVETSRYPYLNAQKPSSSSKKEVVQNFSIPQFLVFTTSWWHFESNLDTKPVVRWRPLLAPCFLHCQMLCCPGNDSDCLRGGARASRTHTSSALRHVSRFSTFIYLLRRPSPCCSVCFQLRPSHSSSSLSSVFRNDEPRTVSD